VIVLDANILLYAYDSAAVLHTKARSWMEDAMSSGTPVGLSWQTIGAFLRVVTNPRIPGDRFTIEEAAQLVDRWLEQPNVLLLWPGDTHWPLVRQTMVESQSRGPLVTDAQLAALTIEYGGILHTTDRDFARFPTLRWINPLSA
jgi:toxin-antitoxin system PIN domain toxin